jgi:hypothetical protein
MACLALVVLAGCADRSTLQDKADNLCNKLAVMDGSVTQLAALTDQATVAQVKALKAKIDAEYKDVQAAAAKYAAYRIDLITKAYNDLSAAVAPVNNQAAVAAALPNIGNAAGEFSDARVDINTTARC